MKQGKLIRMVHIETTPKDVAISRNLQNLFSTYGEDAVRDSIQELFGIDIKNKKSKKKAS